MPCTANNARSSPVCSSASQSALGGNFVAAKCLPGSPIFSLRPKRTLNPAQANADALSDATYSSATHTPLAGSRPREIYRTKTDVDRPRRKEHRNATVTSRDAEASQLASERDRPSCWRRRRPTEQSGRVLAPRTPLCSCAWGHDTTQVSPRSAFASRTAKLMLCFARHTLAKNPSQW